MVYHPTTAWSRFGSLYPEVMIDVCRNDEILIIYRPPSGNGVFILHLEHEIGLTDLPACRELGRLRNVLLVSERYSCVNPCEQRIDLVLRQPQVVLEFAMASVGVPRRHPSIGNDFADHVGSFHGVLKRQQ